MMKALRLCAALLSLAALLPVPASGDEYGGQVCAREILRTAVAADGQRIRYLRTEKPEVTVLSVEIPPGGQTGWHRHPVPVYAYIVQGTLAVETANGASHVYRAGDALVEMVGTPHNGRNLGPIAVKLVAFYTGADGMRNTEKLTDAMAPVAR